MAALGLTEVQKKTTFLWKGKKASSLDMDDNRRQEEVFPRKNAMDPLEGNPGSRVNLGGAKSSRINRIEIKKKKLTKKSSVIEKTHARSEEERNTTTVATNESRPAR